MTEETESNLELIETPPKRMLTWVDLVLVLVGVVIIYLILSLGTLELMDWWPHERSLMYLNAFMTQLSFAILIWILKRTRHWEWVEVGWRRVSLKKVIPKVVVIYSLTWAVNIIYALVLYQRGLNPPTTDIYTKLLGQATWYTLILNLLLAGVVAPLVEETLFRGVIFRGLQTYFGKWTSAIISAMIFSGLHLQVYGFFPRMMLGIALAYLYDKYKSLYPSMALHAMNNIVATLIATGLSIK